MFVGAKGGGSSFKQTPDNLRSNDTFEGVLGLGIGPFKGPTRGLKSIKMDGTAIENATGQQNFQDFIVNFGDGDPLKFPQTIDLKLGAGAAPTQVGLTLPNEDGSNPIWITKTLNNTNADFVDLRFIVQQLFRQDSKGIYSATATLEIQLKPVGTTTWINPTLNTPTGAYDEQGIEMVRVGNGLTKILRTLVPRAYYNLTGTEWATQSPNYVISGKTTSPAVYELRLGLPNDGAYANTGWDIRVRLLERENYTGGKDNLDQEKRNITWESIAAVYSDVLGDHEGWRGVSWLQIYGKASDQLTGVPEITGEYDTKIVKVPATGIFDPETRQYSNFVWDGSWAKAWTNDPAWVINDAISDELSGLSLIAPGSYLNKWDALELSKYCSQLVPDGDGGFHPRYSLNLAISQPQKAEEFVRYMAGAVGALAWDQGDGEWRIKVDKADAPVDLFTLDNIEGEFAYSHTDVDTRFNDIIGQFKNAEMDYRQDAVELFDNVSIAQLGRKPTTIALVGCTNRQEAMRRVKLRLRATVNENRIVTFTTNRRGRNIEQLSTILVADGDLGDQDQRTTGRIVTIASDRMSVTVRDPIYIAPGVDYSMMFTVPNSAYNPDAASQPSSPNWTKPTFVTQRTVTNNSAQRGSVTTIYFDQPLSADVDANASLALQALNLPTLPRLFRVTNVMMQDDGERISISAINIDTGKWDAADNVSKEDTVFQDLRGVVPTPTTLPGRALLSVVPVKLEQGLQHNLQANWVRPAGAFISGFRIQYSVNGGALQTATERQQTATWELPNAGPGTYRVEVSTIDRRGGYSAPLVGVLDVTQSILDATDIYYPPFEDLPAVPVDELRPAERGATRGAPEGTPIVDRLAEQAVQELDFNAEDMLKQILAAENYQNLMDARTLLNGVSVGTVVQQFVSQGVENNEAFASTLSLLGGKSADGTAFIINAAGLRVSPEKSLVATLNELTAQQNGNTASIDDLKSIVIDANGTIAKAVLRVDVNGAITGVTLTSDGQEAGAVFVADYFRIVSPNGGQAITPFSIENGIVKMKNVEVDTLSYNALVSKFGGQYNQLGSDVGYQVMPGGLIMQWGRVRQNINRETTFSVTFPTPFPTRVVSVMATPYLSTYSKFRDLWVQNIGTPTLTGATFGTQAARDSNQTIDGIDWLAFGN